jgi:adenylate cyclase
VGTAFGHRNRDAEREYDRTLSGFGPRHTSAQASPVRYAALYGARLACAHLLAIDAVIAIVIPLGLRPIHGYLAVNLVTAVMLVITQTVAVAVAGALNITPELRWYLADTQPNTHQRRAAQKLVRGQSMIFAATWLLGGAAVILINLHNWTQIVVPTVLGVFLGATAAASIGVLLAQPIIRPIMLAAIHGSDSGVKAPGVLKRLIMMWLLCSTLPCGVIAGLVVIRSTGWIIPKTASVEIPVLVVALAAVLAGLPSVIVISRSISDPLQEVIDAMAQVERGQIRTEVSVYERSQIGRLQTGFNNMVAGLAERDTLRDLFGRHVGPDVARRAINEGASLSGTSARQPSSSSTWSAQHGSPRVTYPSRWPRCSTNSSASWSARLISAMG